MTTTNTTSDAFELKAFDRNRYFYGKLLMARDFEQEQAYFNSKRWLINRLLFGSGVVCGLEVSAGGSPPPQLTVTPGVAIDARGREVVVADETKVKVADLVPAFLAGLTPAAPAGYTGPRNVRLCLSYEECPQEPLPAMKASACEQICDFNRVREGFSFKLREAPPAPTPPTPCDRWMNRRRQSRAGGGVEVERLAPLWVRAGEVFEVAVKVTAVGADVNNVQLEERVKDAAGRVLPGAIIEPRTTGQPAVAEPLPTAPQTTPETAPEAVAEEARPIVPGPGVLPTPTLPAPTLPAPTPPSHLGGPQFPTVPVPLRNGEFFVYVYQVVAPDSGTFTIESVLPRLTPALVTSVEVVADDDAVRNHANKQRLKGCGEVGPGDEVCVDIAELRLTFSGGNLVSADPVRPSHTRRFRYTLERAAELLECVRASLLAEAGSQRPGHSFITFKDLQLDKPKNVAAGGATGTAFTVARADHVHKLALSTHPQTRLPNSGLKFTSGNELFVSLSTRTAPGLQITNENDLLIEGDVGGRNIRFLNTVRGVRPTAVEHLATKGYVDQNITHRLAGLDWQESVLDKDLTAPPALRNVEADKGKRYLLFKKPRTGVWAEAERDNNVAEWTGTRWAYSKPDPGTALFVDDEKIAYLFVNDSWQPFLATPEVAAGPGLKVTGPAVLGVNNGRGVLIGGVGDDQVTLDYEEGKPPPVVPAGAGRPGTSPKVAHADHAHELPLRAGNSGLTFDGDGLRVTVPSGGGLLVDANGLRVDFEELAPQPVGPTGRPGTSPEVSRADHAHELPLAVDGSGLAFEELGPRPLSETDIITGPIRRGGLRVEGAVAAAVSFRNTVSFRGAVSFNTPPASVPPTALNHLTTMGWVNASVRDYVDSTVAAKIEARLGELDWQESVLSKDLTAPPALSDTAADRGKRYLMFRRPRLGDWAGDANDNSIAVWNGTVWTFSKPDPGTVVFVENEAKLYIFANNVWSPFLGAPPPVSAGEGLGQIGSTLFVQPGDGVTVTDDRVAAAFAPLPPPAVGEARTGEQPTVARGDHSHALPDFLNSSTGVFEFSISGDAPFEPVLSPPIDPGLGTGLVSVVLGLELENGEIYILQPELAEHFGLPRVNLGVRIIPGTPAAPKRASSPTRFEIMAGPATVGGKTQPLPSGFRVRWYAYRVGPERIITLPTPTPTPIPATGGDERAVASPATGGTADEPAANKV